MLALLLFVAAVTAQSPWNSTEQAEIFINLGSIDSVPAHYNCTRYAALFTPDGILNTPGIPAAQGMTQITQACENSHGQVDPLISFQELNLPVVSWNNEKRSAFRWTINGVRVRDGADVSAPAVTAFFMDTTGLIENAYSFYDTSLVSGLPRVTATFNATSLVRLYMGLGSFAHARMMNNCTLWADLYLPDGVNNEPGYPPSEGFTQLEALCYRRSAMFSILVPSAQDIIPVESWDATKRLAFRYTLSGVLDDGSARIIPAITVLFMDQNMNIENAWDWWDESLLPPGYLQSRGL
jgi:hypothetical protein